MTPTRALVQRGRVIAGANSMVPEVLAAVDRLRMGPPRPFDPSFSAVQGQVTETIYQPQWDRVNYPAAGVATLSFFGNPIGASVTLISAGATATISKSLRDTSLVQGGVLSTKALDIRALSIHLIAVQHAVAGANTPRVVDDALTIFEAGSLEFKIVDKPRLQLPLAPFRNLDPLAPATTANAVTMPAPGSVGGAVWGLGDDAIVVPANTTIQFTMNFQGSPSVAQAYDILVMLHAYTRRPGQ
jgi:hypothetical protein